jgi:hypothetical protein
VINFKRGTTFSVNVTLKDKAGQAVILDLSKAEAQIRTFQGSLLAGLTITATETAGKYILTTSESTAAWPVGGGYVDIFQKTGSVVTASETLAFNITDRVTVPTWEAPDV